MANQWFDHALAYPESFTIRHPVLDAAKSLRGRWRLASNGKALEVDLPLADYSPHERAVIEFALNPYVTAENIFNGLDPETRHELAKAIQQFFGPGGPADRR